MRSGFRLSRAGGGVGFVAALLLSAPVLAADIYECEFAKHSAHGNWLPTVVVIEHDAKTNGVTVYDPLIKYYKGKPIAGKVETDNDKRISYTWKLDGMKDVRNTTASFAYRLTIHKAGLAAKVSGKVLGYENGAQESAGSCKKYKR